MNKRNWFYFCERGKSWGSRNERENGNKILLAPTLMIPAFAASLGWKSSEIELNPDKLHASSNLDNVAHLVKHPQWNKVFIWRSHGLRSSISDILLDNNIIRLTVSFEIVLLATIHRKKYSYVSMYVS